MRNNVHGWLISNCKNELKEGIKADVMFNFYNFDTVAPVQKIKEDKEPEEKPVIPFFITPANFDYHV